MSKFLAIFAVILVGCAQRVSSESLVEISIGMSKSEVFQILGMPDSVAAKNNTEYLNYRLTTAFSPDRIYTNVVVTENYFVRLVSGKVDAFGKTGDFDSAKDQTVNVTVKQQITTTEETPKSR